jgi:bacillithiol biosynthesis cysteine-adding enzyme BshC
MNLIPFSEIASEETGFSRLFVDYVENFDRVEPYFSADYRSEAAWKQTIQSVANRNISRTALAQILLNQNRDFQCGVQTLANIDLLLNDNTVAVVTGQQVGLFTGPLYTLYKTLTTIKLAEKLSAQFPDYHFVPMFWLESEDHDFDEATHLHVVTASNEVLGLQYGKNPDGTSPNVGSVGDVVLDETAINEIITSLNQQLLKTEFTPKVMELFTSAYQKGMTFTRAFVHLMNVLLENSGLIFVNPHDTALKQLLKPIFKQELQKGSQTCQSVIHQSESLEQQYHAQVKPRPVNLFMFQRGGRYGIEPHPDGYSLKGIRQHYTQEELLKILDETPELFSPNVVLRPICQDFLLPTVAYVAGPGEIAYFAQFKTVYESFGIPEPIIYPRASLTIVEERVQKVLTKFGLTSRDFFTDVELIKRRVTEQISDFKVEELFASTSGAIAENLTSLRGGLESIDATLVPAMETTLNKIQISLNVLKEKTIAAQKRQHEVYLRQLDKSALLLFPNSNMQERQINVLYFLNKYGLEFVRWLNTEMVIDSFKHQILPL